MAEKHTPGPYHIGLPGGPAGPFWSLINRQGNVVAMQITSEANANLLASAPDLLERLVDSALLLHANLHDDRQQRRWLTCEHSPCPENRAAIARANGEHP